MKQSWTNKLKPMLNRSISALLTLAMVLTFAGCTIEIQTVPSEGTHTEAEAPVPAEKPSETSPEKPEEKPQTSDNIQLDNIPPYEGNPFITINDNVPFFTKEEITDKSFETYSDLDDLGRCGPAFSSVGQDIMPTEKRGDISKVKPTGWVTAKYDHVDGKYLYNRCHLLGHQLTGEDANEKNLVTGTRYMNVDGMLPFENMIADYVKETDNHVMYRVTPLFQGDELVCRGVLMEAYSVEDHGEGVMFNVYCYNNQPYIEIDYQTGKSHEIEEIFAGGSTKEVTYIINKNTMKFHTPDCPSAAKTKSENKSNYYGTKEELLNAGYKPCGTCNP